MSHAQVTRVVLYSTDGCHLCDEAMVLLKQLDIAFDVIDIIDDSKLVTLYGTRIPVIINDSQQALNWPFDVAQLQSFLQ